MHSWLWLAEGTNTDLLLAEGANTALLLAEGANTALLLADLLGWRLLSRLEAELSLDLLLPGALLFLGVADCEDGPEAELAGVEVMGPPLGPGLAPAPEKKILFHFCGNTYFEKNSLNWHIDDISITNTNYNSILRRNKTKRSIDAMFWCPMLVMSINLDEFIT